MLVTCITEAREGQSANIVPPVTAEGIQYFSVCGITGVFQAAFEAWWENVYFHYRSYLDFYMPIDKQRTRFEILRLFFAIICTGEKNC